MSKEIKQLSPQMALAKLLNEKVANVLKQDGVELFEKAFVVANAVSELKKALTDEYMKPIMELQNTKIGFKTDKPGGYDEATVKNCIIEATLSGFQVVGNQFNIIAGNMYGTKEGYGYQLKNLPGLNYEIIPTLPRINQAKDGAAIVMKIKWIINAVETKREIEFAIKVNSYMGTDAIIGKATRKARHWLYSYLTGTEIGEGDVSDLSSGNTIDITPADNEEKNRMEKFIKKADSLEALELLEKDVAPDQMDLFNEKKEELKSK